MSSIVAFKEFESLRLSRQTPSVEQGNAKILLFTGVRYERTEAALPRLDDPSLGQSRATKRKRRPF
jgi:hypothetical protein